MKTGTPHDTLAPYPWSRSVKTGVLLRALGNGDQHHPMGRKAWEGHYVFLYIFFMYMLEETLSMNIPPS